jgi:hypothetical protein
MKAQADAIRTMGYEGPLTMAVMHSASQCYVLHLLAYKNMASHLDEQQALGGIRYVLCRPVSALLQFFVHSLRPLLAPKEHHPFVFVQVVGERRGSWLDAKRDGFGRYCGQPNGLNIATSVRTLRHVVTTEAVRCRFFLLSSPRLFSLFRHVGSSGHWQSALTCARPTCTQWKWPMRTISMHKSPQTRASMHGPRSAAISFEDSERVRDIPLPSPTSQHV